MSKTPIPLSMKIDSLLWRAWMGRHPLTGGEGIICGICGKTIMPGDKIDWDHHLAETFKGTTDYQNIRPLHRECHKQKRRVARSKATNQGKDNHEAKRADRIARGGKTVRKPMGKSRSFETRYRKRMNGTVERRTP